MTDTGLSTDIELGDATASEARQCQVFSSCPPVPREEFRRFQEFSERCPNQTEALIWFSCPNGCQYPEEVCAGHIDPPGDNICGYCAQEGLSSLVTVTVIGRI
jgi:hypothetical protein